MNFTAHSELREGAGTHAAGNRFGAALPAGTSTAGTNAAGASAGAAAGTRITARRRKTRDRLLGAALTIFARQGITGTSIEQLCEEAGMTRGAFYSNFSSLDELVLELIERATQVTVTQLTGLIDITSANVEATSAEFRDMDSEERIAVLRQAGSRAFARGERIKWTDSIALAVTEAEVSLYTLRVPELRAPYLRLQRSRVEAIGSEVERLLAAFGARILLPRDSLIQVLATVNMQTAQQALDPYVLAHAPTPDRGDLLAQEDGYEIASLPAGSLMAPAPVTITGALDLMSHFIEFAD